MVERVFFQKVSKKRSIHLLKLVGALLLFASMFKILQVAAEISILATNTSAIKDCLIEVEDEVDFIICADYAAQNGVALGYKQTVLTSDQYLVPIFSEVAALLMWGMAFLVGTMLYKTGRLVSPKEQVPVLIIREREHKEAKKEKEKKK